MSFFFFYLFIHFPQKIYNHLQDNLFFFSVKAIKRRKIGCLKRKKLEHKRKANITDIFYTSKKIYMEREKGGKSTKFHEDEKGRMMK